MEIKIIELNCQKDKYLCVDLVWLGLVMTKILKCSNIWQKGIFLLVYFLGINYTVLYELQAAGRLAQYLELPMVTGLGDLVVRDEMDMDMYETLTVLSYNIRKLSSKFHILIHVL